MITYTMTKDEVLAELASETVWLDSMRPGIAVKYRKQLNPKTAKEGYSLLGITTYATPRKNKVTCAWVRVKTGKYVTIESMHYYEYTTKRGTIQYINPSFGGVSPVPKKITIYSGHALQRLRERAGMTLNDMLAYQCTTDGFSTHFQGQYEYLGEMHTMFNLGDKGMFITDEHEWGIIAKTFVNYELLGEAQAAQIKTCLEKTKQYFGEKMRSISDMASEYPRFMRRSVLV